MNDRGLTEGENKILEEMMKRKGIDEFEAWFIFRDSNKYPGKKKIQIDGDLYLEELQILAELLEIINTKKGGINSW